MAASTEVIVAALKVSVLRASVTARGGIMTSGLAKNEPGRDRAKLGSPFTSSGAIIFSVNNLTPV